MQLNKQCTRRRRMSPVVDSLEGRTLLSTMMPHHMERVQVSAHVLDVKHHGVPQAKVHGSSVTVLNRVNFGGFQFTNFDGPTPATWPGAGPT